MTEVDARAVAAPIDAAELECTLETHVASESKDDGTQEDSADVHKENKYGQAFEVRFQEGAQIQMDFQTRTGGEHVVTKVVKGGSAEQQDVHVGDRLVRFGETPLMGLSEEEVLQKIKASDGTGTLQLFPGEARGRADLPQGEPADKGGEHEQDQEAAKRAPTEAENKLLGAAERGWLQEATAALEAGRGG